MSEQWLWSHYLLSIAGLFSGKGFTIDDFSEDLIARIEASSLAPLFRAERMEFARKLQERSLAIDVANQLLAELTAQAVDDGSLGLPERYIQGEVHFLLANLLRSGGLYRDALRHIDAAEQYFKPGIPSHDTELAHCHYLRAVCYAMQGFANLQPTSSVDPEGFRFASALIQLTYSNAAWFLDDLPRAVSYANEAAAAFDGIEAFGYAARARAVAGLLGRWQSIQKHLPTGAKEGSSALDSLVDILIGASDDYKTLSDWLSTVRPSVALGILQFAVFRPVEKKDVMRLCLPQLLRFDASNRLSWIQPEPAHSLQEAAHYLRTALRVPKGQRVPLIPD